MPTLFPEGGTLGDQKEKEKKRYLLCFEASWQWQGNILHFFTEQLHMLTKLKLPHSREHDEHDGLLLDQQHLRPRLLQFVVVAKERRARLQRGQSHNREVIHSTQIPGWQLMIIDYIKFCCQVSQ